MTMTRPAVSSPLAGSSQSNIPSAKRIVPQRNTSFPSSRALRPFPTISHLIQPASLSSAKSSPSAPKRVKLIEPPKTFKSEFVLDLTQAEFSRQD
ncbi:hypothetical protein CPC08DRAFT_710082 [Agrocybe pediades]|nr:hypothetical protein CPC08DRAFT_710082 [Agrocybe pediades]